jgi:hypothetical protein
MAKLTLPLASAALLTLGPMAGPAAAENASGLTAIAIKIGQTMPYGGPVTAFGTLGKGELIVAATPKFAAQCIRKVYDIG